jgi:hypothetical protein
VERDLAVEVPFTWFSRRLSIKAETYVQREDN